MSETLNYGLAKPQSDDFYDVNVFNNNADTIDQQLKANEVAAMNAATSAFTAQTAAENAALAASVAQTTAENAAASSIPITQKGKADGVAELDSNGKVLVSQLPSYVDDVLEYATFSNMPASGEAAKIYITLDTNLTYRWNGSTYIQIALRLGETSETAYRGDHGKTAYDHSKSSGNPHRISIEDLPLTGYSKPSSTSALLATDSLGAALGKLEVASSNIFNPDMDNLDDVEIMTAQVVLTAGWTWIAFPREFLIIPKVLCTIRGADNTVSQDVYTTGTTTAGFYAQIVQTAPTTATTYTGSAASGYTNVQTTYVSGFTRTSIAGTINYIAVADNGVGSV